MSTPESDDEIDAAISALPGEGADTGTDPVSDEGISAEETGPESKGMENDPGMTADVDIEVRAEETGGVNLSDEVRAEESGLLQESDAGEAPTSDPDGDASPSGESASSDEGAGGD